MKTRTLALCATAALATASSVRAETTSGFIFCSARILDANGGDLSVTLPATEGYVDSKGNPVTLWRIGNVVAGGAVDTFYSDNGPGAFQVRNTGSAPAYLYITSGMWYGDGHLQNETQAHQEGDLNNDYNPSVSRYIENTVRTVFGDEAHVYGCVPTEKEMSGGYEYRLAVSTVISSKLPVWRNLNWFYSGEWRSAEVEAFGGGTCGQYLGYLLPGEVLPFDLKFWAPLKMHGETIAFPIVIEASTFKRWDHDR